MADYVYRGTDRSACGTNTGCNRHIRRKEIACTPCLIAHAAREAERYRAKTGKPPRTKAHCKNGQPRCADCKEARNAPRRKKKP